jgi:hypothetical protein
MMSIAQRSQASYADATAMALDLAPELLTESILLQSFESEIERLYRARAEAQSSERNEPVTPISLIDDDITTMSRELATAPEQRAGVIAAHIRRLERAKQRLAMERWTESQAILQDSDTFGQGTPLPISGHGRDYRDYQFQRDRTLRVRILHPDPSEWKTGVDLIYESYWNYPGKNRLRKARKRLIVRVAALQYKMWDGKRIYLSSDERLRDQIQRALESFCQRDLCRSDRQARRRYGFPHCSVFLRPTDLAQRKSGFFATHGLHVPICEADRELRHFEKAPRIESKRIASSSVSQTVFAELFNRSMLGSRWIRAARLETIYKDVNVLRADDKVVVHAQEYGDNDTFDISHL